VFSIIRTKLVLANFDGGGGMLWRRDWQCKTLCM